MAPRKQPKRIEESALKVIADYSADTVVYHLENFNAAEVESYIALVKDEICTALPRIWFNDFAILFLQRISEVRETCIQDWVEKYGKAVVDVILDDRLTKLERYPRVADHLMHVLFCSMDRLKSLTYLHFGTEEIRKRRSNYRANLTSCNLENLTTFGCHITCTDEALRLIAERCPNLRTLDIKCSQQITSAGLDVLKQCSKLSMVNVEHCGIEANDLIAHLLSHDTIGNISYSIENSEDLLSFRAGVYPKLKSLRISCEEITNTELDVIVRSFPSLDTLFLKSFRITGALRSLRSLSFLNSLGISWNEEFEMEKFESFLSEVGNNYSILTLELNTSELQQVLNVVYKTCKNLKDFGITAWTYDYSPTITIPPFENLEGLSVDMYFAYSDTVHLQFTRLLALQKLIIAGCCVDLKSILLDHDNFPRITVIEHMDSGETKNCEIIRNIIRENNLEVHYHITDIEFFT